MESLEGTMEDNVIGEVVYDLDELLIRPPIQKIETSDALKFESRFEGGNLRKVIKRSIWQYDLILNPDVSSQGNCKYFFFEVSNVRAGVKYVFNIINLESSNSQYSFGKLST